MRLLLLGLWVGSLVNVSTGAAEPTPIRVWPGTPPGKTVSSALAEVDITKPEDRLIAGRRVTRISNISVPTLIVYQPTPAKRNGAAVIICPGGGYQRIATDAEGTEVAAWLNSIGVTGILLKYRVPAQEGQPIWLGAVQDLQRSISLVRSRAAEWGLNPARIGACGFSAGANAAGLAAAFGKDRKYPAADAIDQVSCRPDFGLLIYPANFWDPKTDGFNTSVPISSAMPPMFLVQNYDDPVNPLNALLLAAELKRHNVPAELHMYAVGGHGFGIRPVAGEACTTWPASAEVWLRTSQLIP